MSSRRRPFNKNKLLTATIITLFLWGACIFLVRESAKQLPYLTKISATLDSISIEQSLGRAHPYFVVFNLRQKDERLGINFGRAQGTARKFASQFHANDEVVIGYKAGRATAERNINLNVYQVKTKEGIKYSIAEAQRKYRVGARWAGSSALFFTLILLAAFYREAVRKAQVRKEIAKL